MTVYFQGEMKRISAEIDEEILLQEAESTFLHSESYQFVKQLDDNVLDLEGLYHLVLSSIEDTPLIMVSTQRRGYLRCGSARIYPRYGAVVGRDAKGTSYLAI